MANEPDPIDAIATLLNALEYGKKKEEKELLDTVFEQLGIQRQKAKGAVAAAIARSPGFERFFLAVAAEIRPFAMMLGEVYEFLGRRAHVGRRASTFRVTTAGAKTVFDFSLDAFPKDLLKVLTTESFEEAVMKLALPDGQASGEAPLAQDPLVTRWRALTGIWDNDFYDWRDHFTSFFRLASYASLIRRRSTPADWARVQDTVEPVMDRLAALLDTLGKAGVDIEYPSTMRRLVGSLDAHPHEALRHVAAPSPTASQLASSAADSMRPTDTFATMFAQLARGWAVAVHLWRSPSLVRADDRLQDEMPKDAAKDPSRYVDLLLGAAAAFKQRLDEVAPIVDRRPIQLTLEQLVEFTHLPFWNDRWFLYELWTLVRVLAVAAEAGTLTLEGLTEAQPGVQEWVLPGGMAKAPVARISHRSRSVSVWTQLKSHHPGTGAGLEPDLRIRQDRAPAQDLILIENKDRLSLTTSGLAKIVQRYVTGTAAKTAWFINYETFRDRSDDLEKAYPDRHVRIVSKFRPDNVPVDFAPSLLDILRSELGPSIAPYLAIALDWVAPPEDLDLHVWITRERQTARISYSQPGSLETFPYARLEEDVRNGGSERIVLSTSGLERLAVAVHRYSQHGSFGSGRATVSVTALDSQQDEKEALGTLTISSQSSASWWTVLDIEGDEIRWIDELGDDLPPYP